MKMLNPEKLYVEYGNGATPTEPIIGRRYTLTHSDITGDLFLTIDSEFAYDKISKMRDEVLAEWQNFEGNPILYVNVYVGDYGPKITAIRDSIFRKELPLALEAIIYGDSEIFMKYPQLNDAQIWINFDSENPAFQSLEYWGTPNNYR